MSNSELNRLLNGHERFNILRPPSQPSPLAARPQMQNSAPKKQTIRQEKGTQKVYDHEVMEEASVFLYTALSVLKSDKEHVRQSLYQQMKIEVPQIVGKFGLDIDRIEALGERRASAIADQVQRRNSLISLKAKTAVIGSRLDAMLNDQIDEAAVQSTETPRNTRQGGGLKRAREDSELDQSIQELVDEAKKMRAEHINQDIGRRDSVAKD